MKRVVNKMIHLLKNKKSILIYICYFFLMLYPFNSTITDVIYPNKLILLLSVFLSIVVLFVINYNGKLNYVHKSILFCIILVSFIELSRNYYIVQSRLSRVVLFNMYLILPFIISLNKNNLKYIINVIKLFCIEHIFFTYFIIIFKDFYVTYIIPIISNNHVIIQKGLIYWSDMGYNAGITAHYTTNGIYLSIASIFFLFSYFYDRKKSNIILFILSFIGLILTAKRGLLLYTTFSCIFTYILTIKKNDFRKRIKSLLYLLVIVFFFLFIGCFLVPNISNVFIRFKDGLVNGTLLSGRELFYESAINMWLEKPIFGHGWGYFSEFYQNNIYDIFNPAYNLEYLDSHNVFLQLLCECGLAGFILFLGIMLYIFIKTIKFIKTNKENNTLLLPIVFSLSYQLFFLLYCFSGNPLYDPQCYVMYFLSISIILIYIILNNKYYKKFVKIK